VRLGWRETAEVETCNPLRSDSIMAMRLGRIIGGIAVRGLAGILAMAWGLTAPMAVRGQTTGSAVALEPLTRLSPAELEMHYRQGPAAANPAGRVRGTALLAPGTWRARPLSRGARLVWQGKVIEPGQTTAVNRFFGLRMIRAQVYQGPSWL